MVESHSSNFRVTTTNFLRVRIFRKFTVFSILLAIFRCIGFTVWRKHIVQQFFKVVLRMFLIFSVYHLTIIHFQQRFILIRKKLVKFGILFLKSLFQWFLLFGTFLASGNRVYTNSSLYLYNTSHFVILFKDYTDTKGTNFIWPNLELTKWTWKSYCRFKLI